MADMVLEEVVNEIGGGSAGVSLDSVPVIPLYAMDGRDIQWNADYSACMFDSTSVEYHSDKRSVSSTALKLMQRSPAHYKAAMQADRKETASQRFGTAVHAAVLESPRFKTDYVTYTAGTRQTKAWKQFKTEHTVLGHEILTQTEMNLVTSCAQAIVAAPLVRDGDSTLMVNDLLALEGAHSEINVYWLDHATGLTCKARLDLLVGHHVFDIKTTDDARPGEFRWQAARLGYDIQAAFYLRGVRAFFADSLTDDDVSQFIFIAAESTAPNAVMPLAADQDEFVEFGEQKVTKLMKQFAQCRQSNDWPCYEVQAESLKLPFNKRYPAQLRI